MLVPIFSLNLKQKINLKQVCAGRFDGRYNCLAGATSSGKVTLLIWNSTENNKKFQKLVF